MAEELPITLRNVKDFKEVYSMDQFILCLGIPIDKTPFLYDSLHIF